MIKIKSIEDLKNYNIICTNEKEIRECLSLLNNKNLIYYFDPINLFIRYNEFLNRYEANSSLNLYLDNISFYNFKKIYNKLKTTKDFEINENGKIIKINNYKSNKKYIF